MKFIKNAVLLFTISMFSRNVIAQKTGDVTDLIATSKDHATLTVAIKAAGLVETLKAAGPYTVFAPTNSAFAKLPAGTVETLLKPENKKQLAAILTYHVVAGNVNAETLAASIAAAKGTYSITTLSGNILIVSLVDNNIVLTDESGGKAIVTMPDVKASNGIIHVIDSVLLPKTK
jgi:uncharacterized surface protein with fasciclin (FAS1) repeats